MKIEILGPGCRNCKLLEANVHEAIDELGLSAEIHKVEGIAEIMSYGILSTPGLVIDGKVVHAGSVPRKEKIAELINDQISS